MGFSFNYQSTDPVETQEFAAVEATCTELCRKRTWLSCEPVFLSRNDEGFLCGSSKPTLTPDPEDAASAEAEGLPDGTVLNVADVLCALSLEYEIDWELSHDYSEGHPIGYVRNGKVRPEVLEGLEDLGDVVQRIGKMEELEKKSSDRWWKAEDDGPHILKFQPKDD